MSGATTWSQKEQFWKLKLEVSFIKPEIVCEIKLLEFQGDKSNDEPIRHLKYEYSNKSLNATGRSRSVSILNCNVVNIRPDKKANFEDCGINQIIKVRIITPRL